MTRPEGLFTQKKIRKNSKDFVEDLKSVYLIWRWITHRIHCSNHFFIYKILVHQKKIRKIQKIRKNLKKNPKKSKKIRKPKNLKNQYVNLFCFCYTQYNECAFSKKGNPFLFIKSSYTKKKFQKIRKIQKKIRKNLKKPEKSKKPKDFFLRF